VHDQRPDLNPDGDERDRDQDPRPLVLVMARRLAEPPGSVAGEREQKRAQADRSERRNRGCSVLSLKFA